MIQSVLPGQTARPPFDTLKRTEVVELLDTYRHDALQDLGLAELARLDGFRGWIAQQPGETLHDVRYAVREEQFAHETKRSRWEVAAGLSFVGALCSLPFLGVTALPLIACGGLLAVSTAMHVYHSTQRDVAGDRFALATRISLGQRLLGGNTPPLCRKVITPPPPQPPPPPGPPPLTPAPLPAPAP